MILRQPRSTLTDTLFPYTTLFRSRHCSLFVPKYSRGRARVNDFPFPPRAGRGFQGLYGSGWQPRTWSNVNLRLATSGTEAVIVLRTEEHTSEIQSLMRIPSHTFCLKLTTN